MVKCGVLVIFLVISQVKSKFLDELAAGCGETVHKASNPVGEGKTYVRDAKEFAKFPDKSKGPQREYTWSEVAALDGRDGRHLFLVVCNNVYDVTAFADFHPAGPDPLKKHAGKDATAAIKASGMPPQVLNIYMKRFQVGSLVNADNTC